MRLDAQRERELERRKGFAGRTIVAILWFSLCVVGAYFLVHWLFEIDRFNIRWFHTRLYIPWDWDDWIIYAGLMIVIVVIINFLLLVGYSFFSAVGRRRPGSASLYSSDPDPDDQRFDYH